MTDADGKVTLVSEDGTKADLVNKDIKKILGARKSTAKGKIINKNQNWVKFDKQLKIDIIEEDVVNEPDEDDNGDDS